MTTDAMPDTPGDQIWDWKQPKHCLAVKPGGGDWAGAMQEGAWAQRGTCGGLGRRDRGDVGCDRRCEGGCGVRFTVWLFGHEVVSLSTEVHDTEAGDCTTQPVGFVAVSDDLPAEHRRGF